MTSYDVFLRQDASDGVNDVRLRAGAKDDGLSSNISNASSADVILTGKLLASCNISGSSYLDSQMVAKVITSTVILSGSTLLETLSGKGNTSSFILNPSYQSENLIGRTNASTYLQSLSILLTSIRGEISEVIPGTSYLLINLTAKGVIQMQEFGGSNLGINLGVQIVNSPIYTRIFGVSALDTVLAGRTSSGILLYGNSSLITAIGLKHAISSQVNGLSINLYNLGGRGELSTRIQGISTSDDLLMGRGVLNSTIINWDTFKSNIYLIDGILEDLEISEGLQDDNMNVTVDSISFDVTIKDDISQ